MALCILRILVDISWYLAFMTPVISAVPAWAAAPLALVPCAWGLRLILVRKNRNIAGDFPDVFFFEARFLAVISVLELVVVGIARWQSQCVPFVILFLVFGILLLRCRRIAVSGETETAGRMKFWGLNILHVGGILVFAAVCASDTVRRAALSVLEAGYRTLYLPLVEGLIVLLVKAVEFLTPFLKMVFGEINQIPEIQQIDADVAIANDIDPVQLKKFPLWIRGSGYLILIVFAAAVFIYLYRRLKGFGSVENTEEPGTAAISRTMEPEEIRKDRLRPLGSRDVRYYYRRFLKLCAAKGLSRRAPFTSETACRLAAEYWDETTLTEFRDLYRRARYGGKPEMPGDKKRAAELYRELKEGHLH